MKWTKEQKTVIDLRDCNILVSAAAGSGKTAVLVERILSRIMDKKNSLNVDEFVIVTFTTAAAAEMRERIGATIDMAVAKYPKDKHLAKQVSLLHNAQISTIHSFCGYVINNYFHRIGMDPSYRLMTTQETELLRSDVLKEILEINYSNPSESFMDLLDCYKFDKSDKELERYILQIYEKAMSEPWPKQWLQKNKEILSFECLEQAEWVKELIRYCKRILDDIRQHLLMLKKICREPDGPIMYLDRIESDIAMLPSVEEGDSLLKMYKAFDALDFGRLSTKRSDIVNPKKRDWVKNQRNQMKVALQSLKADFFFALPEKQWEDMQKMSCKLLEILRLSEHFLEVFSEKKRERALADFNDLEQLALEILIKRDDITGEVHRTEAAVELSKQVKEIMIDEYQDSNLVQDILLKSIGGEIDGHPNIFMVGDVKQSIYRFREARPELFTSKLNLYSKEEGDCRRVDLHKNFRSRGTVLDSVNRIYKNVMKRDLGGVEYDEAAALYLGADFSEVDESDAYSTEILALNGKDSEYEREARMIACKIKELTDEKTGLIIKDKERYRLAKYSDIVILVRSVKKVLHSFERVLGEEGVPTSARRTQGFYNTKEISMMVNMLRVLDNPRQDIPLVAVLRSPLFAFDDEELAMIKIAYSRFILEENKNMDYYTYLIEYEQEDALGKKIKGFLNHIFYLRKMLSYAKVADVIKEIYERTDIYNLVQSMPNQIQRTANLDTLMKQAIDFDGTTYHGLFQFVRYLENVKSGELDEGEAAMAGDNDNAVRILTIHASKGLEYPICFLSGMGSSLGGIRNNWLHVHSILGMGTEYVNNEERTRKPTLIKKFLSKYNDLENLGEELRILYVAMTRAKEKMIFTGSVKNWEKKVEQWKSDQYTYLNKSNMTTFFDIVMPSVVQSKDKLFTLYEFNEDNIIFEEKISIEQSLKNYHNMENYLVNRKNNNFDTNFLYDSKEEYDIQIKISVSDLKRLSMEEEEFLEYSLFPEREVRTSLPIPKFALGEEKDTVPEWGVSYGTIWHQAMATIDFTKVNVIEDIDVQVKRLLLDGYMKNGDEKVLNNKKIFDFLTSKIGQEMTMAMKEGKCYREQPFVLGVSIDEIYPEKTSKEMMLVQGIIDAFYETKEGIVLVDYKTDRLTLGQEGLLVQRYQTQVDFYKKALERITKKKVIKCVLYSFSLMKSIYC